MLIFKGDIQIVAEYGTFWTPGYRAVMSPLCARYILNVHFRDVYCFNGWQRVLFYKEMAE